MDDDDEAPGALALIERLVNTRDIEDGTDDLGTPAALSEWLRANDFPVDSVDAAGLEKATRLREGLRELLLANHGPDDDPSLASAKLDALAREAPLRVRFDASGAAVLEPAGSGVDAAIARILAIVAQSQAEGTWARMKACPWDTCQYAFFDRSRNRSRTWCDMSTCGNRAKARTYRARHDH